MKIRRENNRTNKDVWMDIWHLSIVVFFVIFFVFINQPKNPIWNFNWKNIRSEIRDSTLALNEYGELGFNGNFSEHSHQIITKRNLTSLWIRRNATKKELFTLLEFPSAQVKISAYFGLLKTNNPNNLQIIEKLLNDTTCFYTESLGCLGHTNLVCEHVFSRRFGMIFSDKKITTEGFLRLGINQAKMEELLFIYESRVAKKNDYILKAQTKYHYFD